MSPIERLLLLTVISSTCLYAQCEHRYRPCFEKMCWCQDLIANCSDNGRLLKIIPNINTKDIHRFYFTHNYLPRITVKTFVPVKKFHITLLDLSGNEIRSIAQNGFSPLKRMTTLHLSNNTIPPKTLETALRQLPGQFSYLYLNHMNLYNISSTLFSGLKFTMVMGIHLSSNRLTEVSMAPFKQLKHISTITLKFNDIRSLEVVPLGQLGVLWLTSNNLTSFPDLCPRNKAMFPQLWTLGLQDNKITSLNSSNVNCLTELRYLHLSGNIFSDIWSETFSTLSNLQSLDISRNARNLSLHGHTFQNPTLMYLNLSSSELSFVDKKSFHNCTSLKHLDLSNTTQKESYMTYLNSLVHGLTLKSFRCNMCGFTTMPTFVSMMPSLVSLDLGKNEIDDIPDHTFDKSINLRNISLYRNRLRSINSNSISRSIRYDLTFVNLAENPFDCSCELLWLKYWILDDKKIFSGQEVNYTCSGPDKYRGKRIVDTSDLTDKECLFKHSPFIAVVCIVCSVFGSLIILALLYRWRWTIRYNYMKRQTRMSSSLGERTPLLNTDAYVVYCDEDYAWVRYEVMPNMEEYGSLRLIIRQRDFFQKNHVVNSIVDSLNRCKKVLVVISNSFCKNRGCRFELSLVQKRFEDQPHSLVVVLLEDIEDRYMSPTMSFFLQSTTVFTWSADLVNIDAFWANLLAGLRD
ncbi:toll-like receptor 3 [Haliotis rufescens]|uniref:toll-like receptor 3 n=1 Tax=Haliotis rufescens TaxID=6454 RepID=UPI00201F2DD2|nr:toll-like receptor 3 [Haliotis rufescens]